MLIKSAEKFSQWQQESVKTQFGKLMFESCIEWANDMERHMTIGHSFNYFVLESYKDIMQKAIGRFGTVLCDHAVDYLTEHWLYGGHLAEWYQENKQKYKYHYLQGV